MSSGLRAERIVFLPDALPWEVTAPDGDRSPHLAGRLAAVCHQRLWLGCMRLLRSPQPVEALTREAWDQIADILRANRGGLGGLGGGNHFLDALAPYGDPRLHLLVHTGSRAPAAVRP
jgi:hypothetical protein